MGNKIRELRKARDWSQNELAKRSGVDRSYIAYLETAKVGKPSAETFIKLARTFNIRPEELYQAAGYIIDTNISLSFAKETPEDILDRLKVAISSHVPIYEEFPLHAGSPIQPMEYVAMVKERARGRDLEGYIARGKCLEPLIEDGDIIIVDRNWQPDINNVVACLYKGELCLGRLRRIAGELWIENNETRFRLEESPIVATVIEVRRRLK